jgi:hypothetical protein
MKRVMRDVLNIITTIRWLPDDAENQPFAETMMAQEARLRACDGHVPDEAARDAAREAPYVVYYTYLIAYRLLDDDA